ncbi:hypothetical protein ABT160_38050 [Streptomyces sp. NPDC001941]|uniref:hypothetical protein n=1 Tax=Streptomyces sp. NPDC001941 TaxID=3154659 RepID=UPI003334532E
MAKTPTGFSTTETSARVGRLIRQTGAVTRALWQGCPEEGLPPVRKLQWASWLGRVRISGEDTDPCAVQAGTMTVTDWRTAYTAHGGKVPVVNEYYGLPDDLHDPDDDGAWDRAVDSIAHLPVVLLSGLFHGMEDGLARAETQREGGTDSWDLIEAYARLGLVPPANILNPPHLPSQDRTEQLTSYLIAAYLYGARRHATAQLRSDVHMARRLLSLPSSPSAPHTPTPRHASPGE